MRLCVTLVCVYVVCACVYACGDCDGVVWCEGGEGGWRARARVRVCVCVVMWVDVRGCVGSVC
jgi:hypothetical protein